MKLVIVLLAEDSYGVDFYNYIFRELKIGKSIIVRRLSGARCNPKIERQIKAFCIRYNVDKIAIVVDSENERYEKVYNNLLNHIKNLKNKNSIEIFIINPSHEKLLCLGLGGSISICSSNPVNFIERKIKKKYKHKMLGYLVDSANINNMFNDREFKRLISFITDP